MSVIADVHWLEETTFLVELYRALHMSLTWPMINSMAQLHSQFIYIAAKAIKPRLFDTGPM